MILPRCFFVILSFFALIAAAGIIMPAVWFLVVPGLAGFFWLLMQGGRTMPGAFASGFWFGFITGGAGIIWFWDTLPLDFLGIANVTAQRLGVGMTWAYIAFGLALPVAAGAILLLLVRRLRFFPLMAGFIWVAVEIGRMWMFALFTWSPKSLPGPHFSAAAAGYPLTESFTLLQLARPLGLDTLNFLVALFAATAALLWPGPHRTRQGLAWAQVGVPLFLLAFFSWLSLPAHSSPEPKRTLRIAMITDQDDFLDFDDEHAIVTQLIVEAATLLPPVDVIMLPEEIGFTDLFWFEEDAQAFLARVFGEREVLLLQTRDERYPDDEDPDAPEMKMLAYESTTRGIIGRYKKQMLMPLGEYAPSIARALYAVIGDPDIEAHLEEVDQIPFERSLPEACVFLGVRFGGLLCSDLLSPDLYRHLVREENADILFNLSNQFWFHGSQRLHAKSRQIARVHAVRNHRPFLVANNMAPSYAYDEQGRLLAESPWGKRGVTVVEARIP